jgi:hypothetical protein
MLGLGIHKALHQGHGQLGPARANNLDTNELDLALRYVVGIGISTAIIWYFLRPQGDFMIRVRGRTIAYRGRFPLAHQSALNHFLTEELGTKQDYIIIGDCQDRRWRLRFRGNLEPGAQQRIRNFLLGRL